MILIASSLSSALLTWIHVEDEMAAVVVQRTSEVAVRFRHHASFVRPILYMLTARLIIQTLVYTVCRVVVIVCTIVLHVATFPRH